MSRHFKAESINPQNDFLYQAPYELLMKGLEVQQQGYDNMLNQTDLFNQLDIKSINDPTVQKHVQSIKDMYEGRANEITSEIQQDPTKWQKTMPKLRKLAAQLRTDMTSGDIANIQGTYTNWQKFQENLKDKDKRTAAYANKYYMDEYQKAAAENPATYMQFDDIVNPVNLMDKEFQDILKNMKADLTVTTDGQYWYKGEKLSAAQVEEVAAGLLMSHPNYQAYVSQQVKFGDELYTDIDADGNKVAKSLYSLYDINGNKLTQEEANKLKEEWSALGDDDPKKKTPPFMLALNNTHGMSGGLKALGKAYSFFKQDISENQYGLNDQKLSHNKILKAIDHSNNVALQNLKQTHRLDELAKKHGYDLELKLVDNNFDQEKTIKDLKIEIAKTPSGEKKNNLQGILNQMTADVIAGEVYGTERNGFETVLQNAANGSTADKSVIANTSHEARKALNLKPGTGQHDRASELDYWLRKGESYEVAVKKTVDNYMKNYVKSSGGFNNKQHLDNIRGNAEKELKTYYQKQKDIVKDRINKTTEIEYQPLNMKASNNITELIKANPNDFVLLDSKGKVKTYNMNELPNQKFEITHVYGSNPSGDLGVRGTLNGETVNLIPSTAGSVQSTTTKNYALNGFKNNDYKSNNVIRTMLNVDYDNASQALHRTNTDVNGTKKIRINSVDGSTFYMHQLSNGQVKVSANPGVNFNKSEKEGDYITFPNLSSFFYD